MQQRRYRILGAGSEQMAGEKLRGKVRFGVYEADLENRRLTKSGFRIRLQDQPFLVLALLVERAGQVVTRQEIQEKLWATDTFVAFDEGLNTAIKKVRAALNDTADNPRFVETVPKVGYRFIAPVISDIVNSRDTPSLPSPAVTTEESPIKPPPVVPASGSSTSRKLALWSAAVLLSLLAAYLVRPVAPSPRLRRIRQLTHRGTLYVNQNLVSDGTRVYFTVDEDGGRQIAYILVDGGEVSKIKMPFQFVDIHDLSPSGTEFLVTFPRETPPRQLWRLPLNGTSPRQVAGLKINDSSWMPDGRISYTVDTDLFVLDPDTGKQNRLAHVEQVPIAVRWRPEGDLARFMLIGENQNTLWQIKPNGSGLRQVLPDWKTSIRTWPGRWTADGRYYFFVAADGSIRNIWALRDKTDFFHRASQEPVQITTGPINFFQPLPSRDGKTVFVLGEQRTGQLMRYDVKSRKFSPFLPEFSADHEAFSADGNWIAYIRYPEGLLYRSRTDGSEKMQLTFAPMRAYSPHWSPDGRWILFYASGSTGLLLDGYLISRDGGEVRPLGHRTASQEVSICWSPDAKAEYAVTEDQTGAPTTLYSRDPNTDATTQSTINLGFDMSECSPDGKYIAGLDSDNHELMLYDVSEKKSRRVSGYADYPTWSADSKSLYYNNFFEYAGKNPPGVYRVSIPEGKVESVMTAPVFPLTGIFGNWAGISPDGSILVLQDKSTRDLYALDADLP